MAATAGLRRLVMVFEIPICGRIPSQSQWPPAITPRPFSGAARSQRLRINRTRPSGAPGWFPHRADLLAWPRRCPGRRSAFDGQGSPVRAISVAPAEVSGTIEVDLKPGETYKVAGALDAFRREVWLVDQQGRQVGPRIVDRSAADAAAASDFSYTCCNLHYDADWISDANWISQPMIPAGSRIVVKGFGRHRAHVEIEGRPMRIGLDYGRKGSSIEDFMTRIVVKDDPRKRFAAWRPEIRSAIAAGRVLVGMTRDQVIMSLGYPRMDRTASLDALRWVYTSIDDYVDDIVALDA